MYKRQARTVSQGGIVLVGPDDLDQVAEQVKEIFGGVLQRICDLAAAVPVVVGIACPTLVGDNGHAAAGLVIVVVDLSLIHISFTSKHLRGSDTVSLI